MRRMNSMLLGHHGASARTDCMYFSDREQRRRIVPRERQMHDARWESSMSSRSGSARSQASSASISSSRRSTRLS